MFVFWKFIYSDRPKTKPISGFQRSQDFSSSLQRMGFRLNSNLSNPLEICSQITIRHTSGGD